MGYTEKDEKILTLISNFCKNECPSCQECPEDACVLWNIEQVIVNSYKEKAKKAENVVSTFDEFYCLNNPECLKCNLEEQIQIVEAETQEYTVLSDKED